MIRAYLAYGLVLLLAPIALLIPAIDRRLEAAMTYHLEHIED